MIVCLQTFCEAKICEALNFCTDTKNFIVYLLVKTFDFYAGLVERRVILYYLIYLLPLIRHKERNQGSFITKMVNKWRRIT